MAGQKKLIITIVSLVVVAFCVPVVQAPPLQPYCLIEPYYEKDYPDPAPLPPGTKMPDSNDPSTKWTECPPDPCDPNNSSVGPVGPRNCFWIAFRNLHLNIHKDLWVTIFPKPDPAWPILPLDHGVGFNDANATNGTSGRRNKDSKTGNPNVLYHYYWEKQPQWEVIRFWNTSRTQSITFSVYATSNCQSEPNTEPNFIGVEEASFGAPGAMTYEAPFTEVWYLPCSVDVDTSVTPVFSGPAGSGPWNSSFTFIDPFGESRPHGGVKFVSSGYGLDAGDQYSMQFAMTGEADYQYWVYTKDAIGNWDTYFNDFSPKPCDGEIIYGDINVDCRVDWVDFSIFAYNWLEEHEFEP